MGRETSVLCKRLCRFTSYTPRFGHVVRPDPVQIYPHIALNRDRLYGVSHNTQTGKEMTQLLVPKSRRETVVQVAHYNPMAGHMGVDKTLDQIMVWFYWPGIWADVLRWCGSCTKCQLVSQPAIPRVPLLPLPLREVPFEQIVMDLIFQQCASFCVSPRGLCNAISWSRAPAHYLCKEYGTGYVSGHLLSCYPERDPNWPGHVITLCHIHLGNFMGYRASSQFRQVCIIRRLTALLRVWGKNLKSMICKFVHKDGCNWDRSLDRLLVAVQ